MQALRVGVLLIALTVTLGCRSSSGVFETGKDTFSVIETGKWGNETMGSLQKRAYEQANGFCRERGLEMQRISTRAQPGRPYVLPEFQLTFRAVSPDDPEYGRPTLRDVPDMTIRVEESR